MGLQLVKEVKGSLFLCDRLAARKKIIASYLGSRGVTGSKKLGRTMGWVASEASLFSLGVWGVTVSPPLLGSPTFSGFEQGSLPIHFALFSDE